MVGLGMPVRLASHIHMHGGPARPTPVRDGTGPIWPDPHCGPRAPCRPSCMCEWWEEGPTRPCGPGHMVAGPLVPVWVPRGSVRWQVAGLERTRTGTVGSSCWGAVEHPGSSNTTRIISGNVDHCYTLFIGTFYCTLFVSIRLLLHRCDINFLFYRLFSWYETHYLLKYNTSYYIITQIKCM